MDVLELYIVNEANIRTVTGFFKLSSIRHYGIMYSFEISCDTELCLSKNKNVDLYKSEAENMK